MWFDFLPGAAALIFLTYIPNVIIPRVEEFFKGNRYYKDTDLWEVRRAWFRDMYLTGDGNIPTRVDAIPDLPEANQSSESK